jgi:hypothetical protein
MKRLVLITALFPCLVMAQPKPCQDGDPIRYVGATNGLSCEVRTSGGAWGSITGTLSDQTDLQSALDGKSATTHNHAGTYEPAFASGIAAQYFRGDKTWQTLDRAAVGLANVDNTSDASKPISTATQTALDGKAAVSHGHAESEITNLTSDLAAKVPTTRAVNGHALSSDVSVTASDVGLGSVENTALSSWAGSTSITTLGTVTAGSFPWANVSGKPSTYAPSSHANTHQNAGGDEVATATPGPNAIPKAGAGGTLDDGWLSNTWAKTTTPGTSGTAPNWASQVLNIPLASASGVTAGVISKANYDTFDGKAGTGSCTNQVVTATNTGAPTCTTVTSSYVDTSIAKTGTDISTSNQVTATHLSSPLPTSQGGTGANNAATAGRYLKGDGSNFVTSSGSASGTGSCTSQVVTGLNSDAAPTCASVSNAMLASGSYTKGLYHASCTGTFTSSTTVYMPGFGGSATTCTTTTAAGGMPAVNAGTIKNLQAKASAAAKNGNDGVITILKNGSSTGITCTIGAGTACSDTTHSASVAAGDVLTITVTTAASETLANLNIAFELWN